jgi:hypothetical protein
VRLPVTAAILPIALAVTLGGCSLLGPTPTPTPEGQSSKAACIELRGSVETFTNDLDAIGDLLVNDTPAGAVELTTIAAEFAAAVAAIENDEVREAASAASDKVNTFSEAINAAAADPLTADANDITTSASEIGVAFAAIGEVCD